VLLKFKNRQSAFACYQKFNGRRFNMTEPEISHVVYIQSNTVERITIPAQSYPYLNQTLSQDLLLAKSNDSAKTVAELPTCPVCLERMDESITGLLSIQCHHTSQCYCLEKWGCNQCPVCKYSHKPVLLSQSSSSSKRAIKQQQQQQQVEEEEEEIVYECCECTSIESLWICMICGHIGCGRYQEAHAYDHYMDTNHLYALEIETQRVWDYLGDGYVHRLIQNMVDGALVELPPINQIDLNADNSSKRNSHGISGSGSGSASGGSSQLHPSDNQPSNMDTQQGKLDSISVDYSYMLTSQLDSQRMYYEDQLEKATRQLSELTRQAKTVSNEINVASKEQFVLQEKGKSLDLSILEIKKEKDKADKRAASFKDKYEAMQKNLNEEKVVSWSSNCTLVRLFSKLTCI
jgi:BRCA1-associated protein